MSGDRSPLAHALWHALDDAEERPDGSMVITAEHAAKLSALVPEDHPGNGEPTPKRDPLAVGSALFAACKSPTTERTVINCGTRIRLGGIWVFDDLVRIFNPPT